MKRYAYGLAVFAVAFGVAVALWPTVVGTDHQVVSAAVRVKSALPDVNRDTGGFTDCPATQTMSAMSTGFAASDRVGDYRLPAGGASECGAKVARPSWHRERPIWL